ncbi:protein translocase subunit SecD [Hippea maritima]|uniref:Protein translocase subunit SecD n=1 Tax=Hippea maritima (strain ATCC 700847 / DSM 10411 / MH2) TaxID=760142 RepID=F2LVF9_HIPMA|nr:protein translocase subunit SecD [Hippea maritima]AEA33743.1 protein-export membrane protein SecD [Hippea maritima DSM 10411]
MKTSIWIKLTIIIVVVAVFGAYTLPTLIGKKSAKDFSSMFSNILPTDTINLGLDLKGGMHLVLGVDTDKAVYVVLSRAADNLQQQLTNARIAADSVVPSLKDYKITIHLVDTHDLDKAINLIISNFPNYAVISDSNPIVIQLKKDVVAKIKERAIEQAISVIRNRVNQFGVTEPTVVRAGGDHIVVDLPGIKNANRAVRLLGETARLELHLVDDKVSVADALNGELPADDEILYQIQRDPTTGEDTKVPFVVKKEPVITGDMITNATVRFGGTMNQPYVAFELNSEGAKIFANFTATHIGKRLAIVLDNLIYSAPVIQSRIGGGRGQITGNFTLEEAHDLALVLRSGSLPAPVKVLQKVTIGPSLGKISIEKGKKAMIFGALAVILFMIFYYKLSGLLADLALILNIIIIFGTMVMLHATLTLPGIAGIALTVGMAVDANVLIYERIREELLIGRSIHDAVNTGYARAFITILDANITTLIIALILYQFGSGPVKGFAITMAIGLLANMFTAITFTKTIFDIVLDRFKPSKLSI